MYSYVLSRNITVLSSYDPKRPEVSAASFGARCHVVSPRRTTGQAPTDFHPSLDQLISNQPTYQ